MLLTMVPTVAFAAEDDDLAPQNNSVLKGSCGAEGNEGSVQWALTDDDGDDSYTLTISGSGAMADYTANINNETKATQPWRASATGVEIEKITKVVVSKDVTSIGAFAFNGLTGVSEYVIGANVSTISQWALETSAAKVFNLNGNTNFKTDDDGVLFNKEGTTCYNTTKFFNHLDSCLNSSTCCQEVIYDKNTLTWFDSICVHGQSINTIFFFVVS